MPARISIAKAKARFAEFIRRAEAGETVVLTRHGRPVARLGPASEAAPRPAAGPPSADVAEPLQRYEGSRPDREAAPRSANSRRQALERMLGESVWPRVPEKQRGRGPDKREREEILGYGSDGA